MALAAGTRVGGYEVVAPLGAGGMGEVYRARDVRLDREVAIKVLPASFASDADRVMRFEREAKTLASLNHPHIAQIYGIEESHMKGALSEPPIAALVMELVEGETLAERIARGALPLDEALVIGRQVIDALQAAHEAGIVHRDLKPANIKVRSDGTVKVLDFGLAKAVQGASGATGAAGASATTAVTSPVGTEVGMILGTAAYMSPEQARGKAVDQRADIWAFGCVLSEMLTGQQVFGGETGSDSIAAILGRDPSFAQLPPHMPASIHRVLRRCLVRDPRARLQHIGDARLELDEVEANGPDAQRLSSTQRRRRTLATGAFVGAAATALAALIVSRATTPPVVPRPPMYVAVPMPSPASASNGVLMSPDGRHLVSRGGGGVSVLHAFDGSPSHTLEASALCWSPDSRSLVLRRANGDLVRRDLTGGPAVAFATKSPVLVTCTWNREGVLLLAGAPGPFQRVTVSGGTLTPVELQDGAADGGRLMPRFLPDGRRFVYWAVTPDGKRTIRAGSLDSRETTPIVESDAAALYADGYLLFQRGATLVAPPFDERTLALSGEPQAITVEAAPGSVVGRASFDVSATGLLVFATTNGGVRAQQNWVDRRGNIVATLPQLAGAEWLNLDVSPEGTRVTGNRMDPSTGNWDIWVVDVRSGVPTRVTRQPGVDSDAVWSPDGSELVYVSRRADLEGFFRLSLADGREQFLMKVGVVTGGGTDRRALDWTPDGRFVLYESAGNIMALPLADPGHPIPVVATPATDVNGVVSPDGRWIAFQSNDSGDWQIYVQRFQGAGAPVRVSETAGALPQWRGDGRELFWQAAHPPDPTAVTLYAAELRFSGNSVSAAAPTSVFPPQVGFSALVDNRRHWAVARDGQRFLLRQADGLPGPVVKLIINWQQLLKSP